MNFLLGMFMKGNERKASGRGEGGMYGPMESSISGNGRGIGWRGVGVLLISKGIRFTECLRMIRRLHD